MLTEDELEKISIEMKKKKFVKSEDAVLLMDVIIRLKQKNKQMIEALEYYASDFPYESVLTDEHIWEQPEIIEDKGKRAKLALGRVLGGEEIDP